MDNLENLRMRRMLTGGACNHHPRPSTLYNYNFAYYRNRTGEGVFRCNLQGPNRCRAKLVRTAAGGVEAEGTHRVLCDRDFLNIVQDIGRLFN